MMLRQVDDILPIIDAIPLIAIPANLFHIFARHKYQFDETNSAYGRYLQTRSGTVDHLIRAIPVVGLAAAIYELVIKIFSYNQRSDNWSFFVELVRKKTTDRGGAFCILGLRNQQKTLTELSLIFQQIPQKVLKNPRFWISLIKDDPLPFEQPSCYIEYLYNRMPDEIKNALFVQESIALVLIQKIHPFDFFYLHNLFDTKNPKILEASLQKLLLPFDVDPDQKIFVINYFVVKNFLKVFNNKKILKIIFIKYPALFGSFNRRNLESFWSANFENPHNRRVSLPLMVNIPRPPQETIDLFYQTICNPQFLDEIEQKNPHFRTMKVYAARLAAM